MIKEIKFTENALKQIKHLLSSKDNGSFFRIAIKGGGCSGLMYDLTFDETIKDSDQVFEDAGFKILVDKKYKTQHQGDFEQEPINNNRKSYLISVYVSYYESN